MKQCAQCKKEYNHCKTSTGCPKCAPNTSIAEEEFIKPITVHGWVWKKTAEDGMYSPSYTPAQHVPRGELYALVDPKDLIEPLKNTDWSRE
jgi:hypothetical protein